jgi:hypothetical protein
MKDFRVDPDMICSSTAAVGTSRHRFRCLFGVVCRFSKVGASGTESALLVIVLARVVWFVGSLLALGGCSEADSRPGPEAIAGAAGASSEVVTTVELGVPAGSSELDFAPLGDGAVLRLQTFGQGGTHVLVAVRCTGFGNRAFISATLKNLRTDAEVLEPEPARPQLLYCGEEEVCDLVPYLVHASGLTETDEEKDGLPVALTVRVRDDQNDSEAEATREAVLSTADL